MISLHRSKRIKRGERRDIERQTANAQQIGKDIESLGQFSQTLAENLIEAQGRCVTKVLSNVV